MTGNKQDDYKKTKQFDVDRMINEGLAGGWDGESDRNGSVYNEIDENEAPPTLNGKPTR